MAITISRSFIALAVLVAAAVCLQVVSAHAGHSHGHDGAEASKECGLCGALWCWTKTICTICALVSVGTYLLPWALNTFVYKPQNLKKKYNATWAVVTGGSSGIGKALVERLAGQGLNVVIIAVPDELLSKTTAEMKQKFPALQFIAVGADLGNSDHSKFMDPIRAATADLTIQVAFLNAGYIKTGFFAAVPLEASMANFTCNAASVVPLTHYFLTQMLSKQVRGCIGYTCSPACLMPSPLSSLYGATKAFLNEFASSLAGEVRSKGIDVLVMMPSPVATRFYEKAHKMPTLKMFEGTATTPYVIADSMLAGMGRIVVRDQGYYPVVIRFLLKIIDVVFFTEIIARTSHTVGDYKFLEQAQATPAAAPKKTQ